ncbi:MAG: nuclear transport factor 2 family protein [Burkholderiales bacterium]|nr:nuclear transport factor 2 family protein [Burkholderiales bacterium]
MAQQLDVQRLLDRAAIQDVIVRYFQGIDAANADKVRSCFTTDVRAAYHGRALVQGIDALMESFLAFRNKASGEWRASTHFMGNLSFDALSDDSAETETYAFAFLVTPGAAGDQVAMRALRYLDRLRKSKDGWRITHRVHTLDWSCAVPATFVAAFSQRINATLSE